MIPFLKLTIQAGEPGWVAERQFNAADHVREWLLRCWLFLVVCLVVGSGLGLGIAACVFIVRCFTPNL